MNYINYLLALVMLVVLSTTSSAQQTITLQEAIDYALKNSSALTKARMDIQAGDYKIKEVRAAALPQLDATSQLTRSIQDQKFILPADFMGGNPGEFIAVTAGTAWSAMTQVQLNQQLFNQQVFTGLRASKSTKEFYQLAARVAEENLIQTVATNYYQVIINREQLEVIDANMDRISQLEKIVSTQYDIGLAKKIDLDRVKVNKGNLKAQREELQYAISQQKNLLKYHMGMPIDQEISIPESSLSTLEEEATAQILKNDGFNLERLFDYKLLRKQEELLNFQKKANISEYYPSLSIGANYTYNTQSNNFDLYTNKALSYAMSSAALTLRIPIFDGGARNAKVKQSSIDIQKIQEDIKDSSNALKMAYENSKIKIKNSLNTIETQKDNKALAQEVFASTQNNYKNGLASLTDLLDAETELVGAQNSYNSALLNFKIAEIELIKSNGNIKSLIIE